MIMVPDAVIANWNAMGIPAASWFLVSFPWIFQCSLSGFKDGTLTQIYPAQSTAEIAWDRFVAQAAPATPIPPRMIKSRSSPTFRQAENIRKNSGTWLFPTARRYAENRL